MSFAYDPEYNTYICAARRSNAIMDTLATCFLRKFIVPHTSSISIMHLRATRSHILDHVTPWKTLLLSKYPLEDPRIIVFRNMYYISAVESKPSRIRPVIFRIHPKTLAAQRIDYTYESSSKTFAPVEKNWCLFVHNKESVYVHTHAAPVWRVNTIDPETGSMRIAVECTFNPFKMYKSSFLRCSTTWCEYTPSKYLCGLHWKCYTYKTTIIRSCLVEISKETFCPVRHTPLFHVTDGEPIEFLTGMALSKNGNNILLSFGIGDMYIRVVTLSKTRIEKWLNKT